MNRRAPSIVKIGLYLDIDEPLIARANLHPCDISESILKKLLGEVSEERRVFLLNDSPYVIDFELTDNDYNKQHIDRDPITKEKRYFEYVYLRRQKTDLDR